MLAKIPIGAKGKTGPFMELDGGDNDKDIACDSSRI